MGQHPLCNLIVPHLSKLEQRSCRTSSTMGRCGAKVRKGCFSRDSIIEIWSFIFDIADCISCKIFRIESKDAFLAKSAVLEFFAF